MKNKITPFLFCASLLASCATNPGSSSFSSSSSSSSSSSGASSASSVDFSDLKIITPTGAPAAAFYRYAANENYETNSSPSNIAPLMSGSSQYDVVVIDSTTGIQTLKAGANFKVAAVLTFGNFFIAATGNDDDGVMDSDDNIVLFGQGQVPDKLFHYIYGNDLDAGVEYVKAASDAGTCLAAGKNVASAKERKEVDYVFLAEPALNNVLNNSSAATYGHASIYANVQELYSTKSGGKELTQACLFVNANSDQGKINAFLASLESDIKAAIANPDLVSQGMGSIGADEAKLKYGAPAASFVATIKNGNRLGLGYKSAKADKASIDSFLSLFSIGATDETIYY